MWENTAEQEKKGKNYTMNLEPFFFGCFSHLVLLLFGSSQRVEERKKITVISTQTNDETAATMLVVVVVEWAALIACIRNTCAYFGAPEPDHNFGMAHKNMPFAAPAAAAAIDGAFCMRTAARLHGFSFKREARPDESIHSKLSLCQGKVCQVWREKQFCL